MRCSSTVRQTDDHTPSLFNDDYACAQLTVFPIEAMHKRGLCRHAVSVRPSVCLSRSCTLSKRINISSIFFHPEWGKTRMYVWIYVHSSFTLTNVMAILRRKPPHGSVESRWDTGVWKTSLFSTSISLHRGLSMLRPSVVINRVPPNRGKFATLIAVSGAVCWWR